MVSFLYSNDAVHSNRRNMTRCEFFCLVPVVVALYVGASNSEVPAWNAVLLFGGASLRDTNGLVSDGYG